VTLSPFARPPSGEVQDSTELRRILDIPRRVWEPEQAAALARALTTALRTPGGRMELRPIQAIALFEARRLRGLFAPIRVGGGKALWDEEPVLLERGWTAIRDVRPGDRAYGLDGTPHDVLGVFPQGVRPCYRLTFSDGASVVSDLDHLWTFRLANGKERERAHTRTLREWMEVPLFRQARDHRIWSLFLPMTSPVQYPHADLPIDPYTLGALVGDGCMSQRTISFVTMDREILDRLILPVGVTAKRTSGQSCGKAVQYNLTQETARRGASHPNPLRKALDALGLTGTSHTKRIPPLYLRASVGQRLELLRGLLDTDGEAPSGGRRVGFSTVSPGLAEDVQEIAESLGGSVTISHRRAGRIGEHFRLSVRLPREVNPFHVPRKRDLYEACRDSLQRPPGRSLRSIEYVGDLPCTCIAVDSADRLFVTRRHILTHNTLLSLLLPVVLEARRPLVLLPAHLREKTIHEMADLAIHWRLASHVRIESYQSLGRVAAADLLEEYLPDLIVADECHFLKNPSAAVTRRVSRYLKAHRDRVDFCGMSGTVTKRSIRDFAHLTSWALRQTNPLPESFPVVDEWARALDAAVAPHRRLGPGALRALGEPLRPGFRDRLVQSPGVVATQEPPLPIDLDVRSDVAQHPANVDAAFHLLRTACTTPDGWDLMDGMAVWRAARELADGFYYRWDPRPPPAWAEPRKAWAATAREILGSNRRNLDTELQVREAVRAGFYPWAISALEAWERVAPSFVPNPVPVWLSDHTVEAAVRWADAHPQGIVWVDHVALGEALERAGVPYYGAEGLRAATGERIEAVAGRRAVAASVAACGTGRNLQAWRDNLVLSAPPNGAQWEQLLGRTHRDGQAADRVTLTVSMGCVEDVRGFWRAVEDSAYMEEMTGQAHKLVHANVEDVVTVEDARTLVGWAWHKIT
jgi:hypothetical protein